jgi:preprotein translocase subunit SecG
MDTVVIVIHLMVIVALVAVVLLQRSEGGALGIGGGSSLMTSRGQGNVLTKATAILGIVFFLTSITMTVLGRLEQQPASVLDAVPTAVAPATPALPATGTDAQPATGTGGTGILDELELFTGESAVGADAPAAPPQPGP